MISPVELFGLMALCLLAWFWFETIKAREHGVQAARAACEREGVQLLDETVSGRLPRLVRDENGKWQWQRVYEFEYSSSGIDRFYGVIMLLGDEVVMLDISAHLDGRMVH